MVRSRVKLFVAAVFAMALVGAARGEDPGPHTQSYEAGVGGKIQFIDVDDPDNPYDAPTNPYDTIVDHGTEVTVVAVPDEGYRFVKWSDDEANPLVIPAERTVTAVGDTSLTAVFAINTYTLTYTADVGGKIQFVDSADPDNPYDAPDNPYDTIVNHGTEVTAVAVPHANYHFVKWDDDAADPPEIPATRTDAAISDSTITAIFGIDTFLVTYNTPENGVLVVKDPVGVTVASGTYVPYGMELTITAEPNDFYEIGTLTVNALPFTSGSQHTVTGNTAIAASFKLTPIQLPDIITISTFAQLDSIGKYPTHPLNHHYKIADAVDTLKAPADIKTRDGGRGFEPIGRHVEWDLQRDLAFTGTFDGNGKVISGLYINRPEMKLDNGDNVGLFGYIHGATIKNVRLIAETVAGYSGVGALVGRADAGSVITGCYTAGAVSGEHNYIGGMVGVLGAWSTLSESYSAAAVSGSIAVGGLVGMNSGTKALVRECYSMGSVSVGGNGNGTQMGGLVGWNTSEASIINSFSIASVSGNDIVGGFVGEQDGLQGSQGGEISMCFSAGFVTGAGASVGGFVGQALGTPQISSCHFDSTRSGTTAGANGFSIMAGDTATMWTPGTGTSFYDVAGWFTGANSAWGIANNYPYLKKLPHYTTTITVGTGGIVAGMDAPTRVYAQTVNLGVPGAAIRAVIMPDSIPPPPEGVFDPNLGGKEFDGWYMAGTPLASGAYSASGFTAAVNGTNLTLALSNITADVALEAKFTLKTIYLKYAVLGVDIGKGKIRYANIADGDMTLVDTLIVPVIYGQMSPSIMAVSAPGNEFNKWQQDDKPDSLRAGEIAVKNLTYTAWFKPITYSAVYSINVPSTVSHVGVRRITGGSVGNPKRQESISSLSYNATITIEAVSSTQYEFVRWSDGVLDPIRIDIVKSNINVVAEFDVVSVLESDRSIPTVKSDNDAFVMPTMKITASGVAVGPNPVSISSETINVFRIGRGITGELTVYDAVGNVITKIAVKDAAFVNSGRRVIGAWDLRDDKGRPVGKGTYLIRGSVKTADGGREKVSIPISVR